jgi:hypothetical protein
MNILDKSGYFLDKMNRFAKNIGELHKSGLKVNKYVVDELVYFSDKWFFGTHFNGKIYTAF